MLRLPLLFLLAACGADGKPSDAGETGTDPDGPGDTSASVDPDGSDDTGTSVDADGDGSPRGEDCDDADAAASPGATERCDGVDNDCDGSVDEDDAEDAATWYADRDGDQFGDASSSWRSCSAPDGYVADAGDCDDRQAAVHPDAPEICNGVDDDCDGVTDPDTSVDARTWYADRDGDGHGFAREVRVACVAPAGFVGSADDCDDGVASTYTDAPELCNGVDDNCDGERDEASAVDAPTWYGDVDGDSYGDAGVAWRACQQPGHYAADAGDCDDHDAAVHPDATEVCNGVDDDCDATIDPDTSADAPVWYADTDADGHGDPTSARAACSSPAGFVETADDCNDGVSSVSPDATEACNGIDDDCDGVTDPDWSVDVRDWYPDVDFDGYGDGGAPWAACSAPAGFVSTRTDCDDTNPFVHPGSTETCNGLDDDCDSATDEGFLVTYYADADADGYGDASTEATACAAPAGSVSTAGDCDDAAASVHPGATETCDGVDDDCDASTGEEGLATWVLTTGVAVDFSRSLDGAASAPNIVGSPWSGTLHVCPGTWYASILLYGSPVSIVGHGGRDVVVLDGGGHQGVIKALGGAGQQVTAEGVTIQNGRSTLGGGIYLDGSTATLRDVALVGNQASDRGGALYATGATLTLEEVSMEANQSATSGGGLYATTSSLDLSDTVLADNTASTNGGGALIWGSTITGTSVEFTGNSAAIHGGGMYVSAGESTWEDVTWTGNDAGGYGGALYLADGTSVDITDGALDENQAYGFPALYVSDSNLSWSDGSISRNDGDMREAILAYRSDVALTRVDVGENVAGGGTLGSIAAYVYGGNITLVSSTVWGHADKGVFLYDSTLTCSVEPGESGGILANGIGLDLSFGDAASSFGCDFGEEGSSDDNGLDVLLDHGEFEAGDGATFECTEAGCG